MHATAIGFVLAAAVVAVVDWVAVAVGRRAVEYAAKPATLALLLGAAVTLQPVDSSRRVWFVIALVCCLAGDVLLMLPRDLFVFGLGAFLVGHVAYVVGLTHYGGSAVALGIAAIPVCIAAAGLGVPILRAVRRAHPELVGPVAAYMLVISVMVTAAGATHIALASAGAALFFASDASIAWDRFVRPWSWARPWIMITYHLGQAGLVLSLAR